MLGTASVAKEEIRGPVRPQPRMAISLSICEEINTALGSCFGPFAPGPPIRRPGPDQSRY